MKEFIVEGHEKSLLPDGEWRLVWNDEFDGTELDRSKWDYRLSMMGQRFPGWTDKGVHLDGKSHAVFSLQLENGLPVSSQLQTGYNFMDEPVKPTNFLGNDQQWNIGKLKKSLYTHTFGYYECCCKLQKAPEAWWSAFWLQSPIIGASLDPAESGTEVDIMEYFHAGKSSVHCAFTGGYGQDCSRESTGSAADLDPEVFHRFGLLWDETGYTFYIDGKEDGHIGRYISRRPQFILISTEVQGYRRVGHKPVEKAFELAGKDFFLVDHVRVFDKVSS
ncbi:MAG: glycoside hydrolase family 16 protein [Lentisphaeria bacterium]|nr:glycoside hydrolase family 16 protein [Lentisphaeria bacterium]